MGLSAAERSAGNLDEAMDAAVWALEHVGTVEADDTEICEAFVADLDGIRGALTREKRPPEARRAAELASDLATRSRRARRAGVPGAGRLRLGERGGRAGQHR